MGPTEGLDSVPQSLSQMLFRNSRNPSLLPSLPLLPWDDCPMPQGPEGLAWELAVFLAPRAHHSCSPDLPSSLAACLATVAILATD